MITKLTPYEYEQRRRTLSVIIWMLLAVSALLGVFNLQYKTWDSVFSLFGLALLCIPLLWLNDRGYYAVAGAVVSLIVLMVIDVNLVNGDGILDPGILAYPIFIMIGTLLFGKHVSFPFTLAAICSLVGMVYLEQAGYIHPTLHSARYEDLVPIIILLVAAFVVVWVVVVNLERNLERIKQSDAELRENYDLTLEAWAKVLEYRDKETEGHSRRLVDLSTRLAKTLGMSNGDIVAMRRGALLHDIGKLAIPDNVLLKPGTLNEEERNLIKMHPVYARKMLSKVSFLQRSIDVAYSHHEHWDGTGYPEGLKGEQIPLMARLFTVVDQWDALTSDRPYRKAWPRDKVIAYLQENAGTIFDPNMVAAFLTTLQKNEALDNL